MAKQQRETVKSYLEERVYEKNDNNQRNITDNDSRKSYRQNIEKFAEFCKEEKVPLRALKKHPVRIIQQYTDNLVKQGKSPATVHTYIAPICKGAGVPMSDIDKPVRTADAITRSRSCDLINRQGKMEAEKPEFARLVTFQKAVGIRRRELAKLTGKDLVERPDGLHVLVERGKGGKKQLQRVLPENEDIVKAAFNGKGADDRVFSEKEMKNKIDLHGLRAENARSAYKFYADRAQDPAERRRIGNGLKARWLEMRGDNPSERKLKAEREFYKLVDQCVSEKPVYRLGRANLQRARDLGRPTDYDRLALLCVSVYHLSHWRLDVSVTNYML